MRLRGIELLLLLLAAVSIASISATPISRNQRKLRTCLQIAPDLMPCNFDTEATWRSTSGEIPAGSGYPLGDVEEIIPGAGPANHEDGVSILSGHKKSEEFDLYQNDLDITVVYYLEGCLPSRLPFDLPACPIEELQAIQMNKLVPFKLPDLEDALIFPEIDLKQIGSHRQSRASSSHEIPESRRNEESVKARKVRVPPAEDFYGTKGGLQDFHNTTPKRSMKPRTGAASTKYVNMLPAPGPTAMAPGSGAKTEEGSVIRRVGDKNGGISGIGIGTGIGIGIGTGGRGIGDIFANYKNRVQ